MLPRKKCHVGKSWQNLPIWTFHLPCKVRLEQPLQAIQMRLKSRNLPLFKINVHDKWRQLQRHCVFVFVCVMWKDSPFERISDVPLFCQVQEKETQVVIPCARNVGEKRRPALCPKGIASTFLRDTEYVALWCIMYTCTGSLIKPLPFCFILSTALGVSITQQGKRLRLSEILMNRWSMLCQGRLRPGAAVNLLDWSTSRAWKMLRISLTNRFQMMQIALIDDCPRC